MRQHDARGRFVPGHQVNLKHGHNQRMRHRISSEYRAWNSMIGRCERPSVKGYEYYGGRGIKVCERWRHSFENFLEDMGLKPTPNHSLDRINNDGNYEPGNCKWSTKSEQALNRRPKGTAWQQVLEN